MLGSSCLFGVVTKWGFYQFIGTLGTLWNLGARFLANEKFFRNSKTKVIYKYLHDVPETF